MPGRPAGQEGGATQSSQMDHEEITNRKSGPIAFRLLGQTLGRTGFGPCSVSAGNFGGFTLVPTDISWSTVRQRLYLLAWHSQPPSAPIGSTQVSAVKGRKLLPSQLVYQLVVKLLQEFNFLICFSFQNFVSVFQTNFGRRMEDI